MINFLNRKTKNIFFILLLFSFSIAFAQSPNPMEITKPKVKGIETPGAMGKPELNDKTLVKNLNPTRVSIFDHQHSSFTDILKKFVVVKGPVSQVKYRKLKADHENLDKYLAEVSHVTQKEYDTWNQKQQMAFLINSYNGFTLKLIIDNYPIKSIKKIGGFFSSPWKQEFFMLLGKKRTLDWIEHSVLRKKFKEPRIHFAVNCASIGCPALRNEAFIATQLDAQLEDQTQLFLSDDKRNRLSAKSLTISKIFDWFEEDFEEVAGSVAKFIAGYITKDKVLQEKIKRGDIPIKYNTYDWNLNDSP